MVDYVDGGCEGGFGGDAAVGREHNDGGVGVGELGGEDRHCDDDVRYVFQRKVFMVGLVLVDLVESWCYGSMDMACRPRRAFQQLKAASEPRCAQLLRIYCLFPVPGRCCEID